jgi:hypothetical protein
MKGEIGPIRSGHLRENDACPEISDSGSILESWGYRTGCEKCATLEECKSAMNPSNKADEKPDKVSMSFVCGIES